MDLLTSRKFWIGVLIVIGATVLAYKGGLTAEQWIATVLGSQGLYTSGNIIDKKTGGKG